MKRTTVVLALLALSVSPVTAKGGPWIRNDGVAFRLVSRDGGVNGKHDVLFGLQVRPERGWRFFWRSPGPFGLVPVYDFAGSENVATAELLWPAPRRIVVVKETGDSVIGYDRETALPIRVRPAVTSSPVMLRLKLDYGICGDACIPGSVALALTLPANGPAASASAALVDHSVARLPIRLPAEAVRVRTERDTLVVELFGLGKLLRPDLFVEAGSGRHYGPPRIALGQSAVFRMDLSAVMPDAAPDDGRRTVTLVDGARAFEASLILGPMR